MSECYEIDGQLKGKERKKRITGKKRKTKPKTVIVEKTETM